MQPTDRYQSTEPSPPRYRVSRGRPGLIVTAAVLVELAFIGGLGNQAVSQRLYDFYIDRTTTLAGRFAAAPLTYTWRFVPRPGDTQNVWVSQIVLLAVVVLMTGLLTFAVTRGPITFGRALFGVWMAVLAATMVGVVIQRLITPLVVTPGVGRLSAALFQAPNGEAFVVSAGLGLIAGLVAGLVAVGTRRSVLVVLPGYDAPGADAPRGQDFFDGESPQRHQRRQQAETGAAPSSPASRPSDSPSAQSTRLPVMTEDEPARAGVAGANPSSSAGRDGDDRPTTQLPREQPPQRFPRPPDDDDLGYHHESN